MDAQQTSIRTFQPRVPAGGWKPLGSLTIRAYLAFGDLSKTMVSSSNGMRQERFHTTNRPPKQMHRTEKGM